MSANMTQAVSLLLDLTTTAVELMTKAQHVSAVLSAAYQQGRVELTEQEWQSIRALDAAARARLQAAIDHT